MTETIKEIIHEIKISIRAIDAQWFEGLITLKERDKIINKFNEEIRKLEGDQ